MSQTPMPETLSSDNAISEMFAGGISFSGKDRPHGAHAARVRGLFSLVLVLVVIFAGAGASLAITAPELRGQRALQQIEPDMHGRNLRQQEFLKSDLTGVDLHGADLRGAVFNGSNLQGADLREVDLQDAVVYASRLDRADLRGALLRNAMLMQSRFSDARIADADFSGAVLDRSQRRALCARAEGTHPQTGVLTRDSLECD
ncbi:MAG: pentapeptide repeat-containing protein [Cyanobacteriota bacterium]